MTNIALADPSYLAREGFKSILNNDDPYRVIGEIKNAKELWFKLSSLNPDILVIDDSDENFFDFGDYIKVKEHVPSAKVIVISNPTDKQQIMNAINQGVLGYLTKECDSNEIFKALDTVSKGEKFICDRILNVILEKESPYKNREHNSSITGREIEIIRLIAEGNSNSDIAEKLFLSIHTVYTHRKNIMRKLQLKSPVELVLYALNSGMVEG